MFILISVKEREILTEGFDSLKEAENTMKAEFLRACRHEYGEEELEDYEKLDFTENFDNSDCGWDTEEHCAYVTGNNNYDWRIVEY